MLRLLVLVLVLANIGFYAWSEGMLDGVVGARAQGDREPDRMTRQVQPDLLKVLPAASAASAVAIRAEAPALCLEAGPYTSAQVAGVESTLQAALPAGAWTDAKNEVAAVWIVYMGRYPNREALQKKVDELKRLRVTAEELRAPAELEGGLALGRYSGRDAAETALEAFTQRGVRTARVAPLTPASTTHTMRVERADNALQAKLAALKGEALAGKSFGPCANRT